MTDTDQRDQRTRHALTIGPDTVAHIVSLRHAATKSTQPRVQQTKEPPTPLNVDAVDDSDYTYQALTYWAGVFAGIIDQPAPHVLRSARRTQDGTIVGFPSTITAATAHAATRALTTWILVNYDRIHARAPFQLREFHPEADRILTLDTKWPTEDGGTQSQVPCPHHDDTVAITLYPPLEYGMPRVIVCDQSHYFDEDELAALNVAHVEKVRDRVTQARKDQADRERGVRTMRHLLETYGEGIA